MMFYSETNGSKPGRALAVPLSPLEKRCQFPPLENTMCPGTKIEMTTDSLKEITVEEEDRS